METVFVFYELHICEFATFFFTQTNIDMACTDILVFVNSPHVIVHIAFWSEVSCVHELYWCEIWNNFFIPQDWLHFSNRISLFFHELNWCDILSHLSVQKTVDRYHIEMVSCLRELYQCTVLNWFSVQNSFHRC